MKLTEDNYYGPEANMEYLSVSQFKRFRGTVGYEGCEFRAMQELTGEWKEEKSTALMVGSYVDAYFEGTLESYKIQNPDMFTRAGELKAPFKQAETCIARVERDDYWMKYMSGEKQVIMTADICGAAWKIKMDSYLPHIAIVDLKVVECIDPKDSRAWRWVKDAGKVYWPIYYGYDLQGAIYQEVVYQNTGERLPFYLAVITKDKEPDYRIIQIPQSRLDDAMLRVPRGIIRIEDLKAGREKPAHCGSCDCCRANRSLEGPVSLDELIAGANALG